MEVLIKPAKEARDDSRLEASSCKTEKSFTFNNSLSKWVVVRKSLQYSYLYHFCSVNKEKTSLQGCQSCMKFRYFYNYYFSSVSHSVIHKDTCNKQIMGQIQPKYLSVVLEMHLLCFFVSVSFCSDISRYAKSVTQTQVVILSILLLIFLIKQQQEQRYARNMFLSFHTHKIKSHFSIS